MILPEYWPNTNMRDANLDWMLKVMREFYNDYDTIDEHIRAAQAALDAQGEATLAAFTASLNALTEEQQAAVLAAIDAHAEEVISQIPEDYTALTEDIAALKSALSSMDSAKIPFPVSPDSKYGTSGQNLRTLGNGRTQWTDAGLPTDAQTAAAVSAWLNDHPEATTTVQNDSLTNSKYKDDSISMNKLDDNLKYEENTVEFVKLEYLYNVNKQRRYTQGITCDGTYIYYIDFYSESDCDLVKCALSDGSEIARIVVTDVVASHHNVGSEINVHGNGIAFCDLDSYIYILNTRGNYIFRFTTELAYVDKIKILSGQNDPNCSIAWCNSVKAFAIGRSYSNRVTIYSYEQLTTPGYIAHSTFPYHSLCRFEIDRSGLSWSLQNFAFYNDIFLIAADRHGGGLCAGVIAYGINGRWIQNVLFETDSVEELEGIFVNGDYLYAFDKNGNVYRTSILTNTVNKPLLTWGGASAINFAYKNACRYFTVYDLHETSIVDGQVLSAGTELVSDIPMSYQNAIQADFLLFYIECDGNRAVPIVVSVPNENIIDRGSGQTRNCSTCYFTGAASLCLLSIKYHFEVVDNIYMKIVVSDVTAKFINFASNGTFNITNATNLRIDGIVAQYL